MLSISELTWNQTINSAYIFRPVSVLILEDYWNGPERNAKNRFNLCQFYLNSVAMSFVRQKQLTYILWQFNNLLYFRRKGVCEGIE